MGHEAAGVVEEVGNEVTNFQVGDRVTFDSTIYCGHCFYCREGRVNLCDNRRVMGVSCGDYRQHGAFAEWVVVPERIAYTLPASLPFEQAAMVEAVSVAVHAVGRTPLALGDAAVVVGAGMIGQLVVQTLRARGCGTLIAIDLDEARLELAQKYGADHTINANSPDVPAQVMALTQGHGAAVALEVVGAAKPLQTAIACVRKGGSVTLIGNLSPNVEIPLQAIVTRELSLIGTCASSGEYPACMELMARGVIDVSAMISAVAPLEEGAQWFDRLYQGEAGLLKVLLQP
jgi:L-iditol 2-dehydrogenase